MPLHDWSSVSPGTYHNFHYRWIAAIMDQLNSGILPPGCFAMAEQVIGGPEPDVVTLHRIEPKSNQARNSTLVAETPVRPKTSLVMVADEDPYIRKANHIAVRHELGHVLAIIELVSPGNKNSMHAIRSLTDKLVQLLFDGVNLLVIDPLPPGPRDPQGLHGLIWSELSDQPFQLPADGCRTVVSYQAAPTKTAWLELMAIGAPLPTMPLFLQQDYYVNLPLEASYSETWSVLPAELRRLVTVPGAPH